MSTKPKWREIVKVVVLFLRELYYSFMRILMIFLLVLPCFGTEIRTLKREFNSTKSDVTKIEAISQAYLSKDNFVTIRVGLNSESKKPLGLNIAMITGKTKWIVPVKLTDKERILHPQGARNVDLKMPLKEICFLAKGCKKKSFKVKFLIFIDKVFWKDYKEVNPMPSKYKQSIVELLIKNN